VNVLKRHGVATLRMLEQKISDAGPNPQRVDPHVLSHSRSQLQHEGRLLTRTTTTGHQWHCLTDTDRAVVEQRYAYLLAIDERTKLRSFTLRMGQTAEIAVHRALQLVNTPFIGHFSDLDQHDDSTLYAKTDPDFVSGRRIQNGRLDYIIFNPEAGQMGVEIKNIREWIYPDRSIMIDLLRKCVQLDTVPVIIARRIHYSTFSVMNACGVVIHQFYNQLYPTADAELADQVRQKLSLGYFDVKVGNNPDDRLVKFFANSLPAIAAESLDKHKVTIAAFASGEMPYAEFVAKVRGKKWHEEEGDLPEDDSANPWEE
jgi:hypothetical protein